MSRKPRRRFTADFKQQIGDLHVQRKKRSEIIREQDLTPSTSISGFVSDLGKEFDNQLMDDMLEAFGTIRSLSQAGCPYDNAMAESTYRAFKIEFVYQESFSTLEELAIKTRDYTHWWNNHRLHNSLNYQTPKALRIIA